MPRAQRPHNPEVDYMDPIDELDWEQGTWEPPRAKAVHSVLALIGLLMVLGTILTLGRWWLLGV